MRKKLLSALLAVCMTAALFVPCIMLPASADITAPHPASVAYDFSDWDDHCIIQGDKYTTLAAGVIGINGDPALTLAPIKQGKDKKTGVATFDWNHFGIPFVFENDKDYVISYDITTLAKMGSDTPAAKSKWTAFGTVSNEIYGNANGYKVPIQDQNGANIENWDVESGKWTHVTGYIPKGTKNAEGKYLRNGWIDTTDCLFFYEETVDGNNYGSQIAIDNFIIMEKTQFELTYPNGSVPTRTDTPAVDMLAANWNNTRYMPFLATDCFSTNATSVLDSDGKAKCYFAENDNLFAAFNFQSGKTYHLTFDIALDPSHAEKYPEGITLKAVAMDSSKGIAENTVEAFTGGVAIPAGKWTHVDMTLTAANAHTFFGMKMETEAKESKTAVWIDNFKLYVDGKEPACPTTPRTGDANPGVYQFISNFEDGRNHLHRGAWYWNTESEIFAMSDGNHVEKVRMGKDARNFGYMSFTKDHTYVVQFDVYGVSNGDGSKIDSDRKLRIYAQQYTLKEDKRNQFTYKVGDNLVEDMPIVSEKWTHYTAEVKVTNSGANLFSFFLNGNKETIFYIDNLSIVEKSECNADNTDKCTPGVWITDPKTTCAEERFSRLHCAVCNKVMETKTVPADHTQASEPTVITPATCTTDGESVYKCVVCGAEMGEKIVIPKLGHKAGNWEATKEATCHETGTEVCKCTVCGETVGTREIPKLNHIEGKWVTDVEAAVGVEGHRYKKCTLCGDIVKEEKIAALPAETTGDDTTGNGKTENSGCKSALGGFSILGILTAAGVMIKRKKH